MTANQLVAPMPAAALTTLPSLAQFPDQEMLAGDVPFGQHQTLLDAMQQQIVIDLKRAIQVLVSYPAIRRLITLERQRWADNAFNAWCKASKSLTDLHSTAAAIVASEAGRHGLNAQLVLIACRRSREIIGVALPLVLSHDAPAKWPDCLKCYSVDDDDRDTIERGAEIVQTLWFCLLNQQRTQLEQQMHAAGVATPMPDVPMSEPTPPNEWVKVYGVCWDTLKKRLDSQVYRNVKISNRAYRIAISDIPAEHHDRFARQ